jgi:hypothetical protein
MGLDVESIVLLASIPIVPVPPSHDYKIGYILGPVLAVVAIVGFFGTVLFLQLEKVADIRASRALSVGKGATPAPAPAKGSGCCGGLFGWRAGKEAVQSRAARKAEQSAAAAAAEQQAAKDKAEMGGEEADLLSTPQQRRLKLPKLSLGSRKPSGGATPRDTARTSTPSSPGVLYVDHV